MSNFWGDSFVDVLQYIDVFVVGSVSLYSAISANNRSIETEEKLEKSFTPELERGEFNPFDVPNLDIKKNEGKYTKDNNVIYFNIDFMWQNNSSTDPTPLFLNLPFFPSDKKKFNIEIKNFSGFSNVGFAQSGSRFHFLNNNNQPISIDKLRHNGSISLNGTYTTQA